MLASAAKIAGFCLLVYLMVVAGLYLVQRRMMYFPAGTLPPAPPGWQAVRLDTADGLALAAWYYPAEGSYTIAYFHGNGGNIDMRVGKVAPLLAAGHGVLLVEYRGYGGNPGEPTEDGLLADGRAALAFLRGRGVKADRTVLLGESLGSGVAVALAAEAPVSALLLEAPFTSAADVGQRAYPWLPARWLIKDRFDSAARIGEVRAPVLIVHGAWDRVVPVDLGTALYRRANEPKQLVVLPRAGHNDMGEHGLLQIELEFLQRLAD
jgi:fermentation-respiration switch protein FrsA (DUF1100 family)